MTQPSCSPRDAGTVLTIVAACHRKTAPKLDGNEREATALAVTWAELFSAHSLTLPDLLAGVKLRAQHEPDAPEPADIIQFARKVRLDRPRTQADIDRLEALAESKSEDAAELAALREQRAIAPKVENPSIMGRILTTGKRVPNAE